MDNRTYVRIDSALPAQRVLDGTGSPVLPEWTSPRGRSIPRQRDAVRSDGVLRATRRSTARRCTPTASTPVSRGKARAVQVNPYAYQHVLAKGGAGVAPRISSRFRDKFGLTSARPSDSRSLVAKQALQCCGRRPDGHRYIQDPFGRPAPAASGMSFRGFAAISIRSDGSGLCDFCPSRCGLTAARSPRRRVSRVAAGHRLADAAGALDARCRCDSPRIKANTERDRNHGPREGPRDLQVAVPAPDRGAAGCCTEFANLLLS